MTESRASATQNQNKKQGRGFTVFHQKHPSRIPSISLPTGMPASIFWINRRICFPEWRNLTASEGHSGQQPHQSGERSGHGLFYRSGSGCSGRGNTQHHSGPYLDHCSGVSGGATVPSPTANPQQRSSAHRPALVPAAAAGCIPKLSQRVTAEKPVYAYVCREKKNTANLIPISSCSLANQNFKIESIVQMLSLQRR